MFQTIYRGFASLGWFHLTMAALIALVAGLLMFLSFALIAGQMLLALAEAYIGVGGGVLILGFSGSRWTIKFAEGFLGWITGVGVKLLFLYLLVGIGMVVTSAWNSALIGWTVGDRTLPLTIAGGPHLYAAGLEHPQHSSFDRRRVRFTQSEPRIRNGNGRIRSSPNYQWSSNRGARLNTRFQRYFSHQHLNAGERAAVANRSSRAPTQLSLSASAGSPPSSTTTTSPIAISAPAKLDPTARVHLRPHLRRRNPPRSRSDLLYHLGHLLRLIRSKRTQVNSLRPSTITAFLLVCLMAAFFKPALADDVVHSHSREVDQLFAQWNRPDSPGCAVAVMKDGRILYERGYGIADLDHDVKITPATVFHVGSISKQFTAAALLMLVQDGKISLDDPIRKYVPEVPDFGRPITLRELLHHTSGLRDWEELLVFDGWRIYGDVVTEGDVLDIVSRQKDLNFPSGSEFLYSNTGYSLLAQVVARVSGQSLADFTATHIFRPLAMQQTEFRRSHAEPIKNLALGYRQDLDGSFKENEPNLDTVGCTNLMTTVEDLAHWDENFYTAHVGGAAVLSQMTQPGKLNNGTPIIYGAGLFLGPGAAEHSGSDGGYAADMIRFPSQHLSVATLCNLVSVDVMDLTHKVAVIYGAKLPASTTSGGGPAPNPPTYSPSPNELRQFAGTYRSDEIRLPYTITAQGAHLTLHAFKIGTVPMVPISKDEFSCTQSVPSNVQSWRVRFTRDNRGRISGFLIDTAYWTRNLRFTRVQMPE